MSHPITKRDLLQLPLNPFRELTKVVPGSCDLLGRSAGCWGSIRLPNVYYSFPPESEERKKKKGDHTLSSSSFHRKSYRIRLFFSSTYGGRAWPLGGSRVLGRHPDSPPSRTLRLPKARKQRGRWREKMTLPTTTTRVVSSKVRSGGRHAHTEGGGSPQDEIKGETFG